MPTLPYTIIQNEDGSANVALFLDGEVNVAHSSHPNYKTIVKSLLDGVETDYVDLFDVGAIITREFARLSERVTVRGDDILLDGDPVGGPLQDQILAFLDAGEPFGPLVNFYEKLLGNPLGDVREGVYSWAKANGLTVTDDGNLLGYKAVTSGGDSGYRPSRPSYNGDTVNGIEVKSGEYLWQKEGDVVEMPRSKAPSTPSAECGVGLHVGTYTYAQSFTGDTVLLVEFNPRDIVSLPDSCSSWKLRVCRYTVVRPVDGPLDSPIVHAAVVEPVESDLIGERVVDIDGDEGEITGLDEDGFLVVTYDDDVFGTSVIEGPEDLGEGCLFALVDDGDNPSAAVTQAANTAARSHGSGPTAVQARGNGRNPDQDAKGRFSAGRSNSVRDNSTGRFSA